MSVATNIVKGVLKRLRQKKHSGRFEKISWKNVKLLKHQNEVEIKRWKIKDKMLFYKRPYELMHTYAELFEQEIYRFKASTSNPLIIDCGANIGMSVLYFKTIYPDAFIIAFEPDDDNFRLLQQNVESNKLKDVQLMKAAVWSEQGTLQFASAGTQGSRLADDNDERESSTQVQAERLADWLQKPIDFLKIDIEGVEDIVLEDCASHLHNVANMFVEYHGEASDTPKLTKILSIMSDAGFKTYVKTAADDLEHPFEKKHTGHTFDVQLNLFCYR